MRTRSAPSFQLSPDDLRREFGWTTVRQLMSIGRRLVVLRPAQTAIVIVSPSFVGRRGIRNRAFVP